MWWGCLPSALPEAGDCLALNRTKGASGPGQSKGSPAGPREAIQGKGLPGPRVMPGRGWAAPVWVCESCVVRLLLVRVCNVCLDGGEVWGCLEACSDIWGLGSRVSSPHLPL